MNPLSSLVLVIWLVVQQKSIDKVQLMFSKGFDNFSSGVLMTIIEIYGLYNSIFREILYYLNIIFRKELIFFSFLKENTDDRIGKHLLAPFSLTL